MYILGLFVRLNTIFSLSMRSRHGQCRHDHATMSTSTVGTSPRPAAQRRAVRPSSSVALASNPCFSTRRSIMMTYVDICHHDVVQTIRSDSGDVAGCRHHHRTSHTCMRITPMTRVKHAPLWYVHNHNKTIIEPLPGRRYRREKQARSFVNWPVGGPI